MDTYISLGDGIIVTLFSIIMVFLVLIVILIFISMLKNIDRKEKPTGVKVDKELNAASIKDSTFIKEEKGKIDDGELLAVISAAVAVSLDVKTQEINIKSIRRVSDSSPVWSRAGRQEQVHNRV